MALVLHVLISVSPMPLSGTGFMRPNHKVVTGAYIHIPFCRRRCFYCDFPVAILGERESTVDSATTFYTEKLIEEISATAIHYYSNIRDVGNKLETLYFGGGTPSLLSVECLGQIVDCIDKYFGFSRDAEITLEMDPGTFDLDKLKSLKKIGINRISLGVQSFSDEMLQKCGRAHTAKDVSVAIENMYTTD